MQINSLYRWSLALTLAGALLASPADAQGKGKGKEKHRARPELVRRESSKAAEKALKQEQKFREQRLKEEFRLREEALKRDRERWEDRDDRWDDDRWDDRYDDRYDDRWESDGRRKGVPPGWCKGKGNPHNTPENCGYGAARRDDRYDDRNDPWYGDRRDGYGSYEREHEEFHRWHDRECRMRAAERPLDLQWQLRVRQECKARHDEWHYRAGRRHS